MWDTTFFLANEEVQSIFLGYEKIFMLTIRSRSGDRAEPAENPSFISLTTSLSIQIFLIIISNDVTTLSVNDYKKSEIY